MGKHQSPSESLQKRFTRSTAFLQAGDIAAARKGFVRLSKQLPHSAAVWYNLGLCHQHLGQYEPAIAACLKSLKIKPGQIEGWVNIGIAYLELDQLEKSEQAIRKALALNPDHSRALNSLGTIQVRRDNHDQARMCFNKSLEIQPANRDAKFNLANMELNLQNYGEAHTFIDSLLASYPDDRQSLLLKARIFLDQKELKQAAPIVLGLETDAPDEEAVLRLGLAYREAIRDPFGVITSAEKLIRRFPNEAKLWNSLASACFQLDGIEKSKQYYQKAIALDPQNPEFASNLGLAYSSLGDQKNAAIFYRKSLQLNPHHVEAYRHIAAMKRFKSIDDADAQQLISIWENRELDDLTTIETAFALGKIYDDCGLYDEAFAVYKVGNDLKFKESRLDLAAYFDHIQRIPRVLNSPSIITSQHKYSPRPIFILGMPRSGTTLVEQIICRHSEVYGCGELPCIERAITRLEKRANPMRVYPDDFRRIGQSELEIEAREYLAWVKRLHNIECAYLTDKMPFNFAHIWLIKALFPDSVIVHCQRHPLDVIVSNYFQLYGSDVSFVYHLEALTKYYIRYHQLMIQWQALYGDAIYNVVYEDLVSDVENQVRQLINATGLAWEDNCQDPKQSNTAVRTASIWQVRQGIYTRSKQRFRNYQSHLQEVIARLCEAGILDHSGNWIERA